MKGRLQFKHKKDICVNRDAALSKVEEMKKDSLYGEPIVIQYYEYDKIELMLCIGTKDAENKHDYHIIDTRLLDNKISENVKKILRVENKLNEEISERKSDVINLTSTIAENKQLFNSLLDEEKTSREEEDAEILSTIETLEVTLKSKIDTENEERNAVDESIISRIVAQDTIIDTEINNRVKDDINNTVSEKNTISAELLKNNSGTTLSFDVKLDSSADFLSYDDGEIGRAHV